MRAIYQAAVDALLAGDGLAFENELRKLALQVFRYSAFPPSFLITGSVHDVAKKPELWYHAFLLTMIVPLQGRGFVVESNAEAGMGRADLLLYPQRPKPSEFSIILEIKTIATSREAENIK